MAVVKNPSRIIRFVSQEDGKIYYGEPVEEGDLGLRYHAKEPITAHVLSGPPLGPSTAVTSQLLTVQKLLSPLAKEDITTILGMGAQFVDKSTYVHPDHPVMFLKPATTLNHPEDPVVIPGWVKDLDTIYEVEIGIVLSKDAKNVSVAEAMDYVWGFTTINDLGAVKIIRGGSVVMGKSLDGYTPVGPVLVAKHLVSDPDKLELRCTVNGETVQKANTSQMTYSISEVISKLSRGVTLEAGTLILAGSPPPLAPEFLRHGDEVRVSVEGLGTLINYVEDEKL